MTQTWDFSSGATPFDNDSYGNSLTIDSGDLQLVVTAWSDTGDYIGDDTIESAQLTWAQSGALGVRNRDEAGGSPNHSIDSVRGSGEGTDGEAGAIAGEDDDMLMLEFSEAVDLSGIDLSWAYDGGNSFADVSILYWDGVTGSGDISGKTWSNILTTGGYKSAGNYANVGLAYQAVNALKQESTRWLIGVYNTAFGAATGGLGAGNDGFKLDLVKSTLHDGEVPVPSSLALVMLGLAGLFGRRQIKRRPTALPS